MEEPEIAVRADHAVIAGAVGLLIEHEKTDVRVGQHVAAEPQRGEVGRERCLRASLLNIEGSDAVLTNPAGQTRATENRNRFASVAQPDAPAEEQDRVLRGVLSSSADIPADAESAAEATASGVPGILGELEDAGILQKEIALFGEEEAEAREIHLLLIDFDLREIRVDRKVPRQAARHAVLHVEPGVEVTADACKRRLAGAPEDVRLDSQVAAGSDAL